MGSIMMDRWSIESIINFLKGSLGEFETFNNDIEDRKNCKNIEGDDYDYEFFPDEANIQCWDNFLTAIVLWDEIWSLHHENMYKWKNIFSNDKLVQNLNNSIHQLEKEAIDKSLLSAYIMLSSNLNEYFQRSIYERTLGYQILSNGLGVPFLAHPSRREYFIHRRTYDFYRTTYNSIRFSHFSRRDIFNRIDDELMEYYDQINKEVGRKLYSFNYPVLIDYIRKDTQTPAEELEKAIELKMDNDVVVFREKLFDIEQSIKLGNTQMILSELKMVSDLAKDITNKYQKRIDIGEFTISLSPSLTIPISIKKNKRRELHATFIRRLLNYGVYERGVKIT